MFTIPWTFVHVLSPGTLLVSFRAAGWDSGFKFMTTAPTYTAQSVPTPWLALTAAFASPRQCLCTEIILGCKVPQYDFFAKRVNEGTWITGNNPFQRHCLGAATELWPLHICSISYSVALGSKTKTTFIHTFIHRESEWRTFTYTRDAIHKELLRIWPILSETCYLPSRHELNHCQT